jgi:repressor LexA
MVQAGIHSGDTVIVKKQRVANKGDIVVAIIGDEATVKRFFPEGDRVRLQPENDTYAPILVNRRSPDFRIAGKVVGLLRKL